MSAHVERQSSGGAAPGRPTVVDTVCEIDPAAALGSLDHIGYVVDALATAVADLRSRHGLADTRGNFEASFTDASYRGAPACFAARYHFLSMGGTDLEVIEPLSGDPSPYRDFLEAGGRGVHHLAFVVDSIDDRLAAAPEATVLVDARIGGDGRFVYVEGLLHGVLVELIRMPTQS